MIHFKQIKTNVIVVSKLVFIFVALKIIIRYTLFDNMAKSKPHKIQHFTFNFVTRDNSQQKIRQDNLLKEKEKIYGNKTRNSNFAASQRLKNISSVGSYNSGNNQMINHNYRLKNRTDLNNGNYGIGHIKLQDKNLSKSINNVNHGGKNWDKKPPFATHTLDELEILNFHNISKTDNSKNSPYSWHSKLKLMRILAVNRKRFPRCIIIGVNKAGTLALLEFLNLHPSIVKPGTNAEGKNELKFFTTHYSKGYNFYLTQMPVSKPGQITAEKSPGYFRSSVAAQRIHRFYEGNVKLLLIVRNPVERTVSEYLQKEIAHTNKLISTWRNTTFYPIPTLKDMVTVKKDNSSVLNTTAKIIQNSVYHQHTKRWIDIFSRKNLHIVNGDVLKKDPVKELRKIETFLSLPHDIRQEQFYFNATKRFYCYKTGDKGQEQCLKRDKGMKHPSIDAGLLKQMDDYFLPHNQAFYDLVGEDFGWNKH